MISAVGIRGWFIEPVSYFPILGVAGTYMAFLTGNISAMRLPCAAASQVAMGAQPGTKKGEIAGILGIAASIVVSTVCLTLLVFVGRAIVNILPPIAKAAFKYVLPGVFGGMFITFAKMGPMYALVSLAIGMFSQLVLAPAGISPLYLSLLGIFGTVAFAYQHRVIERKRESA